MPLVEEQLRHPDGFLRAAMPGDQQQREILPGRRAARADDAVAGSGLHENALFMERHVGKLAPEQRRVAPMRRGLLALEQTRLGKHERAAAGRIELRALRVHAR